MKIVRFDSVGGASGDMILGALVGLGADISELSIQLSALLPYENFSITSAPYMSYGINGIQAIVTIKQKHHDHDHHHHDDDGHHHDHKHERSFSEISDLIKNSILPEPVITQSLKVFTKLATAEAKIHNVPVENVHFHEVGAVDSIIDIVGSCLACHLLGIDAISVSTLPTGSGTVKCRHGIYPVPAPATTEMLTELATMPCDEEPFELVTPTGAALLASWSKNEITSNSRVIGIANSFGQHKLKTRPNLLRAILYEVTDIDRNYEKAVVLETNIDDCSPEIIGNLCQKLTDKGVLDVWTTSATMKKQRLGVILSVLVKEEMKSQIIEMIFRETTTLGIREYTVLRQCLERSFEKVETLYGTVRVKTGKWLGETLSRSPEFEDCRLLSEKSGVPLKTIQNLASK